MLLNTTLPRILGACFYYPPQSDTVQRLWPLLPQIAELFPWSNPAKIARYCQQMPSIQPEQLEYDFSILFEGQGEMPAPPWGSVYLDKENILMGDSTLQYREFLSTFGLVNQKPELDFSTQYCSRCLACTTACQSGALSPSAPPITAHPGVKNICQNTYIYCDTCADYCDKQALLWRPHQPPTLALALCDGCGECAFRCPARALEMQLT